MAKAVKTAENQLRQAVLDALGQAVAAGELPAEPIPAFGIEVPADRAHGDLAASGGYCNETGYDGIGILLL